MPLAVLWPINNCVPGTRWWALNVEPVRGRLRTAYGGVRRVLSKIINEAKPSHLYNTTLLALYNIINTITLRIHTYQGYNTSGFIFWRTSTNLYLMILFIHKVSIITQNNRNVMWKKKISLILNTKSSGFPDFRLMCDAPHTKTSATMTNCLNVTFTFPYFFFLQEETSPVCSI